jgi:two-component system, LytTR family, sensor kinase
MGLADSRFRWLLPLALFWTIGLLEIGQAYFGYQLAGQPALGYTLRGQQLTLGQIFVRLLPSWTVAGILGYGALFLAVRFPVLSKNWQRMLGVHVFGAVVFSVATLAAASFIRHRFFVGPETGVVYSTVVARALTTYFSVFFVYYWVVVGVYSTLLHHGEMRDREVAEERLRRSLSEANLEALKRQLQPHFLYNTLNTVGGLAVRGNTTGVLNILDLLGELLSALLKPGRQTVSLDEELALLDRYARIQKIRLGDKFDLRVDVPTELRRMEVPTFLLQPLIENSVIHGMRSSEAIGQVMLTVGESGSRLHLTVLDSGRDLSLDAAMLKQGVGLSTTRDRLRHLYGNDCKLELTVRPSGGIRVDIEWPRRVHSGNADASAGHGWERAKEGARMA